MSGCCAPKGATRKLSGYDNFLAKGPNSPSVANGVPSVISAMLYFDELPDDASITQLAQEFYSFDALSSRPQSGWWVPCEFNRDHHVHAAQAEGVLTSYITAAAGGTFLFVALGDILPKTLAEEKDKLAKLTFLLSGFGAMSLLAKWT